MRLRGLVTLKKRREFAYVKSRGRTASSGGLLLQAAGDPDACEDDTIRVGFTISKKSGNAVTRNRIRRRLRVAAQDVIAGSASNGFCYVLISSSRLSEAKLDSMRSSLSLCLKRLGLVKITGTRIT